MKNLKYGTSVEASSTIFCLAAGHRSVHMRRCAFLFLLSGAVVSPVLADDRSHAASAVSQEAEAVAETLRRLNQGFNIPGQRAGHGGAATAPSSAASAAGANVRTSFAPGQAPAQSTPPITEAGGAASAVSQEAEAVAQTLRRLNQSYNIPGQRAGHGGAVTAPSSAVSSSESEARRSPEYPRKTP